MKEALKLAIQHIEHMSAFITKANSDYHCGTYSFESLGEDMPAIRAAVDEQPPSDDIALCIAERDAAIEVSAAARKYVEAMQEKLLGHERDLAALIAKYYRREIGTVMQQAEHWAKENYPLAVHHRVMKADSYFQFVALCERFAEWGENPFEKMRHDLAREPMKPPGTYPPTAEINLYRHPKYVVAKLATVSKAAGGDA
jgi:hypothetical protein